MFKDFMQVQTILTLFSGATILLLLDLAVCQASITSITTTSEESKQVTKDKLSCYLCKYPKDGTEEIENNIHCIDIYNDDVSLPGCEACGKKWFESEDEGITYMSRTCETIPPQHIGCELEEPIPGQPLRSCYCVEELCNTASQMLPSLLFVFLLLVL